MVLLTVLFLYGCGGTSLDNREDRGLTEKKAYDTAQKLLRVKNYRGAIEVYRQLESQFPFGQYAQQAQLENIYAHYKSGQPDAAREAAERFIRLYPEHPRVDYAYYLHGLAAFSHGHAPMRLFFLRDVSVRDPQPTRDAFDSLQRLVRLFPNSEYAPDARQRMIYLRNLLATREVKLGHYYMSRKAYVAALNRGRYVVENYSQTPAVVDGLVLMIDAYLYLGLQDMALDVIRILRENYPDHRNFTEDNSYRVRRRANEGDRNALNLISFGLLARPDVPPPIVIPTADENTGESVGTDGS